MGPAYEQNVDESEREEEDRRDSLLRGGGIQLLGVLQVIENDFVVHESRGFQSFLVRARSNVSSLSRGLVSKG